MGIISQRRLADMLGLSVATISRALHQDPRVHPQTRDRVQALLKKQGYQLDPVVSAGMSKIRRHDFHRETIAWCHDLPRERMPWLKELFASAETYGNRLGYKIEHFHFDSPTPKRLARLQKIWTARGIRGVLLGPLGGACRELVFPSWEGFTWVAVGNTFKHPDLHSVGRDYHADIQSAIAWLQASGSRRPGFLLDTNIHAFFRQPMVESALAHYHRQGASLAETPYYEFTEGSPDTFAEWMEKQRPDGIVLTAALGPKLARFERSIKTLPAALLSPPSRRPRKQELYFTARYDVIGQAAVNMLHRLLGNRESGLPGYKQSVLLSSRRSR